jgi:hypothetical protein
MDSLSQKTISRYCPFKAFGLILYFCIYFFGGLECVGHAIAYVAYFVFLRDVWIRTQRAAIASRHAINLATHVPSWPLISLDLATHLHLGLILP